MRSFRRMYKRAGFLSVLTAAFCLGDEALGQAIVDRVSIAPRSDGGGYVVRFHTDERIAAFTLQPSGDSIEIVLFRAQMGAGFFRDEVRGSIRNYEVRQETDRIVASFELEAAVRVESTAYHDRESNDLLLALNYGSADDGRVVTARPENPPPRDASSQDRSEIPTDVRVARPPLVPTADESGLARYLEEGEKWKLDVIVIDAGHGGHDPGAVANGLREKDITLAISRKLGDYIEQELGIKVVYTRSDDRFVPLDERGRIANQAGGKLFISIHGNSVGGSRARTAHGTETFILGPHRSDAARRVMERENAVIRFEHDTEIYEQFNEANLIYQSMALSTFMRESERLASLVEDQFRNRAARTSRGVKQAGLIVLWAASMPAVLVEVGFLTNPNEARFLGSEQGQAIIASAIFRAVREYKEIYEKGLDLVSAE